MVNVTLVRVTFLCLWVTRSIGTDFSRCIEQTWFPSGWRAVLYPHILSRTHPVVLGAGFDSSKILFFSILSGSSCWKDGGEGWSKYCTRMMITNVIHHLILFSCSSFALASMSLSLSFFLSSALSFFPTAPRSFFISLFLSIFLHHGVIVIGPQYLTLSLIVSVIVLPALYFHIFRILLYASTFSFTPSLPRGPIYSSLCPFSPTDCV